MAESRHQCWLPRLTPSLTAHHERRRLSAVADECSPPLRSVTQVAAVLTVTSCHIPAANYCMTLAYAGIYRVGQKTDCFSDLITLWWLVLERRAVCQNFQNFIKKKVQNSHFSEFKYSYILCQICLNHHNSWNYSTYDQITWILLNLH